MPDLADRVSRGAVAALDLAPFDDRFGRLSRQVLAGGAARFARVVDESLPVRYVIPVALASGRIGYGALVLQDGRAALLWRDSSGTDHHEIAELGPDTVALLTPVLLGEEEWLRFEVDQLTFLIPPTEGQLLRTALVDFLGTQRAENPTASTACDLAPVAAAEPGRLPASEPEPAPEPDPERVPEPEPGPITAPELAITPEAPPIASPAPAPQPSEWTPTFDLYRPAERIPADDSLGADATVTLARPSVPAPPSQSRQQHAGWHTQPPGAVQPPSWPAQTPQPPSWPAQPQQEMQQPRGSATLRGFLLGLLVTLAVAAVIIIQLL